MKVDGNRNVLLTGGAGYIGSHTFVALREAGFEPIIVDDFRNSHPGVLSRLHQITGRPPLLENLDVLNTGAMEAILSRYAPVGVVHFAASKAVGESVVEPLKYFHNNIGGALSLLRAMETVYMGDCSDLPPLVFSSSATVYGEPAGVPVSESSPINFTNPYGHTKVVVEQMLQAIRGARPSWRVAILRYFNPVGAHPSGMIGEHSVGVPNNLMPYIAQVALGQRPCLNVYGGDYQTVDGTGVRDYIHVQDLAQGHVAALEMLLGQSREIIVNLGTGQGYSVLEVISAFERASGHRIPYRIVDRRPGDVAKSYADASLARSLLGWAAQRSLDVMCADTWRWHKDNPHGYCDQVFRG